MCTSWLGDHDPAAGFHTTVEGRTVCSATRPDTTGLQENELAPTILVLFAIHGYGGDSGVDQVGTIARAIANLSGHALQHMRSLVAAVAAKKE